MNATHRNRALTLLFGIALCGCAESKAPEASKSSSSESASTLSREERIELRRQRQGAKNFERASQEDSPAVTGEAPEQLLDKVMADLEQRSGATRSEFKVQRAESVQWSDGSLGCPEPGMAYQQSPVNGYWILIDYQGQAYDYRTSERGYFVLCSDSGSVIDQIQDKEKGPRSGAPVQ